MSLFPPNPSQAMVWTSPRTTSAYRRTGGSGLTAVFCSEGSMVAVSHRRMVWRERRNILAVSSEERAKRSRMRRIRYRCSGV